jgi:predicted esterase
VGSTGRHLTSSLDLSIKVHEIRSHLGDFKLRVIGNTSSDHVPIIALPGAKLKLFDEWTFIAEYLSKHGFVVYVLYVYGWKNQSRAASLIYESLFKKTDGQGDLVGVNRAGIATPLSSAIVMGKSAGGSLAQSFARAYPKEISKLCLICPVASEVDVIRELSGRDLKLFLAWAEDDPIAPFTKSGLWKSNYKESLLSFTSAKRGGHAILDEYAVPLLRFLKS